MNTSYRSSRRYPHSHSMGVSPKEWMLFAIIAILFIICAIFITGEVQNNLNERNTVYFSAHKVEDKETMDYTMATKTNNLMVYGAFTTDAALHTQRVSGAFTYLSETVEKYTRHTRTVTDSKGNSRTETYYTWDHYATNTAIAPTIEIYGHTFKTANMDISKLNRRLNLKSDGVIAKGAYINSTYINDSLFATVGDLRYSYTYVPRTFVGNMLVTPNNGGTVSSPFKGKLIPFAYGTIPERLSALEGHVGIVPYFATAGVLLLGILTLIVLYKYEIFTD